MGETLTEQRRVKEEVIRYVNFCHRGRTVDIGNDIQVTVLYKKATANYVPAAAVIRRWRALSGIIGRKEGAGGTKSVVKDRSLTSVSHGNRRARVCERIVEFHV